VLHPSGSRAPILTLLFFLVLRRAPCADGVHPDRSQIPIEDPDPVGTWSERSRLPWDRVAACEG